MPLPQASAEIPFNITRFSHVRLLVTDLDASREFYEGLVGLVVAAREADTLYLRGVEEVCHHSLVLQQASERRGCDAIAFRVRGASEFAKAQAFLEERGLEPEQVTIPHQGPTLRFVDPLGLRIELCAGMETVPRYNTPVHEHRGAAPIGIDHCQALVPDVDRGAAFYAELGFRSSEVITMDGTLDEPLVAAFMARKGNANDFVLVRKPGPRLHHFSYVVHEAPTKLFHLCDLADSLGLASAIEWGPARHGAGHEAFIYVIDPDGNRVELLSHPFRFMDPEEETFVWSRTHPRTSMIWGPPPPQSWQLDASPLVDTAISEPDLPTWTGAVQ